MAKEWKDAEQARVDFIELVEPIAAERADHATLCGTWTVHQVTAHLVSFVDVGLGSFFLNIARHRFDYDRAADTLARRLAERPMADLLATLRSKARKASALPIFPEAMTVMDAVVHTQDVRRGVGLTGTPPPELVAIGLEFLTTHKQASQVVPKGVYDDLRIEAIDTGWSHGDGPVVSGAAEALLMGMTGRPVYDELGGDGLATLRKRLGS